jgi:hypothetical protein
MAKYKDYSYDQGVFLPVYFDKQILPGTFEYSLNHLIDNEVVEFQISIMCMVNLYAYTR